MDPTPKIPACVFDIPLDLFSEDRHTDSRSVESLYSLKVIYPGTSDPGFGKSLQIDLFRHSEIKGEDFGTNNIAANLYDFIEAAQSKIANYSPIVQSFISNSIIITHLGQATFDGRFSVLKLNNFAIITSKGFEWLLDHAKEAKYGPHVNELLPLSDPVSYPLGFNDVVLKSGALVREKMIRVHPQTLRL